MIAVISPEHPASPDATALIAELDAHLGPLYPSAGCHGFSVQKLIADSVAFLRDPRQWHRRRLWRYQIVRHRVWRDQTNVRASAVSRLGLR